MVKRAKEKRRIKLPERKKLEQKRIELKSTNKYNFIKEK